MKNGILPDKAYNVIKWILIAFIPPFVLLLETLSSIYGFDASIVIKTITALATFFATIMGISNYNYYKKKINRR